VGAAERDKLREVLRGVLFDWRGTLVADPPNEWWLCKAMERLGRDADGLGQLVDALDAASRNDDVAQAMLSADCSSCGHREATMLWFQMAGLDDELAAVLYDLDFETEHHAFLPDVAEPCRPCTRVVSPLASYRIFTSTCHSSSRPQG
jgi:hypothetical protein